MLFPGSKQHKETLECGEKFLCEGLHSAQGFLCHYARQPPPFLRFKLK